MPESDVIIRECVSIEDFNQCIELERAIWKDDDIGIMPIRLYMISKACKAPTIGAFDSSGKLVGFVHTMLSLIGSNVAYHSHMAAVIEGLRHSQIGYRMKLAQRDFALDAGIPLIVWTFDPLQSRNAHLNINKLGAVIRRYEANYYGEGLSTVFGLGVPSDRVFAEWWVRSPHVTSVLAGNRVRFEEGESITIPYDINSVNEGSVEERLRWRLCVREEFQKKLGGGPIIRGFVRDAEKRESRYILGPDEEQFSFEAYKTTAP
jgi:predicted GNAT superfamily acetyltransferase